VTGTQRASTDTAVAVSVLPSWHEDARHDEDVRVCVEQAVRDALPAGEVVRASVYGGVVLLVGHVAWRSALAGIDRIARAVPGVVDVCNRINYAWDDGAGRS
jgi:osmotically-inducible protein OsmY